VISNVFEKSVAAFTAAFSGGISAGEPALGEPDADLLARARAAVLRIDMEQRQRRARSELTRATTESERSRAELSELSARLQQAKGRVVEFSVSISEADAMIESLQRFVP